MAINDVVWKAGSAEVFSSSGDTVVVYWRDGTGYVQHEYAEGGVTGGRVLYYENHNIGVHVL